MLDKVKILVGPALVNGTIVGATYASNIETMLKILVLLATLVWTVSRVYRERDRVRRARQVRDLVERARKRCPARVECPLMEELEKLEAEE